MVRTGRRRLLAVVGTTFAGALAGCGDVETEFVVSNTQIVHQVGQEGQRYPEDVGVRVAVDNTTPNRQEGTVVVTLEKTDGDEAVGSWTQREELSVSRGTSVRVVFVFESVFEPGDDIDDFRVRAEIE